MRETSGGSLSEHELDHYLGDLPWAGLADVAAPFFHDSSHKASEFLRTLQAEARLGLRLISSFVSPGMRILEVGSGMGLLAGYLHSKGLDVTALEPGLGGFGVSGALSRAVQKCPEFAALRKLDLPAESLSPDKHALFDFIYSVNVLEHIPRLDDALIAMASVLAENGEMLHTCPNYTVPYEPHFGVALFPLFPRCTAPLVTRRGNEDLWDSLKFVTAGRIRKICRSHSMEVWFQPEVMHRSFMRLDEDSEFLKRQSNGIVVNAFRVLKATGVLDLLRYLPAGVSTPMVFRIRKQR